MHAGKVASPACSMTLRLARPSLPSPRLSLLRVEPRIPPPLSRNPSCTHELNLPATLRRRA
eukprot:1748600-Pyramimonas_sp.AAC.1